VARHLRLKALLAIAALGASLATPIVDQALASSPTLPDISAALTAAGVDSSAVTSELDTLGALAPGGSLPLGSLDTLDNSLLTLNNGLVSGILTLVTNLLLATNPAAPTNIQQTLSGLQQIGSAAGASNAVKSAVAELSAALTTAGLGQLMTQAVSASQSESALSALTTLQSLPLGGSVPAGSLAPVGTVLSAMGLGSEAAILNGSTAISPAQLETVIANLEAAASPLASALAAQLADSTSIFGGLSSVGNPVSASTATSALSALQSLPGLPAGSSVPGGLLAPVGSILSQIAGEPGVPAPVAQTLNGIAAVVAGSQSINPATLQSLITTLQGLVASLPSPLGGLLSQLLGALSGSGSLHTGGSTGTGGTGGNTGSGSGNGSGTGGHGGHAIITHLARHGRRLVVSMRCTASSNRTCHTTVTVKEKGHRTMRKTITFRGGSRRQVRMRLAISAELAVVHQHRALRVLAKTGSYTARRTIH
jgi:hypothetical protein